MLSKKEFEFTESSEPITEPISKFGGQLVWRNTPHWPIDPYSTEPMLFMGQLVLDPDIFPDTQELMAYIFFGNELEPVAGSAMAIVLQNLQTHSFNTQLDPGVSFLPLNTGPTIFEFTDTGEMIYREYRLSFGNLQEEKAVPLAERYSREDLVDYEKGYQFSKQEIAGNKIGGQPMYVEQMNPSPEYFSSTEWQNLLQLAPKEGYSKGYGTNFYPFHMNMYGFSIVNFFISKDYKHAQAYTQAP